MKQKNKNAEPTREHNPYSRKKWSPWIKAFLIKLWFCGAVYFFVGLGLFLASADQLDLIVALGLVMGAVNDLAVNRIFRSMETARLEYHPYMMMPDRAFYAFFINVAYGLLLSFVVAYTYNLINIAIISINHLPDTAVPLGTEPILYGVFCAIYDFAFTHLKSFVIKRKKREYKNDEVS